jgi:hypothetical protein
MKLMGSKGNSRRRWVSELIDPTTKIWNEGVIRECCNQIDSEAILSIKLLSRQCEDFVA